MKVVTAIEHEGRLHESRDRLLAREIRKQLQTSVHEDELVRVIEDLGLRSTWLDSQLEMPDVLSELAGEFQAGALVVLEAVRVILAVEPERLGGLSKADRKTLASSLALVRRVLKGEARPEACPGCGGEMVRDKDDATLFRCPSCGTERRVA